MPDEQLKEDDVAAVERCETGFRQIREELGKVIIGQEQVVEQVLVAMLSRGHALLEGVPGLAKTLLVSSLADSLHLSFKRIQFTPDLMPSDITGAEVIQEDQETHRREYRFLPGPIFANMLLADEINRTPPKTQAAMLEAMQERHVSAGGMMHSLPAPFFVLATQNPLEQEGTYPLPEAQLDRFLLYVRVDYPSGAEEWDIARRVTSGDQGVIEACMSGEEIIDLQHLVTRVPASDQVLGYAWALVRASRPGTPEAAEASRLYDQWRGSEEGRRAELPEVQNFVDRWVNWGAGPRGVLTLVTCAKARAILHGRFHATTADVQALAKPALRHRIAGNYTAQANDVGSEQLIEMLMKGVSPDREYARPAA